MDNVEKIRWAAKQFRKGDIDKDCIVYVSQLLKSIANDIEEWNGCMPDTVTGEKIHRDAIELASMMLADKQ